MKYKILNFRLAQNLLIIGGQNCGLCVSEYWPQLEHLDETGKKHEALYPGGCCDSSLMHALSIVMFISNCTSATTNENLHISFGSIDESQ